MLGSLRVRVERGDAEAQALLAEVYRKADAAAVVIADEAVDELRARLIDAWEDFSAADRTLLLALFRDLAKLRIREALGENVTPELDVVAAALLNLGAVERHRTQVLVLEVAAAITRFVIGVALRAVAS